MSGKRKAPWRDWRREHLPRTSALLDGEIGHYLAILERDFERIEEARRADACCIECHALMLVGDSGYHYCPFERARIHARAIAHSQAELLTIQLVLLGELNGDRTRHRQVVQSYGGFCATSREIRGAGEAIRERIIDQVVQPRTRDLMHPHIRP